MKPKTTNNSRKIGKVGFDDETRWFIVSVQKRLNCGLASELKFKKSKSGCGLSKTRDLMSLNQWGFYDLQFPFNPKKLK